LVYLLVAVVIVMLALRLELRPGGLLRSHELRRSPRPRWGAKETALYRASGMGSLALRSTVEATSPELSGLSQW